ncbi:MAG: carotenoid oxygenase family protein [Archangium sp.]|nr:carotenoid oxygenase family protein [Archangium sp.]
MSPRARAFNAAMTAHPGALELHVEASRIEGVIPPALRGGRVLSNGPGWLDIGGRLAHPFDGHGYVRSFEFQADGSLKLRARFVDTPVYRDELAAGRLVHRGLGTNVGSHFWQNLGFGAPRNVANTTIVPWAGRLLAGWEGGAPYALDPETLATRGEETFGGALAKQATLAHFKIDSAQQRLVSCSIAMGPQTKVTFREFDAQGALATTKEVALPGQHFAHDFVITPRWYVLASNPLRMKFGELALTLLGASTLLNSIATKEGPGELYLIPRDRPGPLRTVTLPGPAFVVHYGNAFDEGETVHVDASLFEHFEFGVEFGYRGPDAPLDPSLPDTRAPQRLYRISVGPNASEASWKQLARHAIDFPRVHPEHDGLDTPALFGTTRADTAHSDPFDSLIRVDLKDPERPSEVWTAKENVLVGEPLLAPEEFVLAVTSAGLEGRSNLCVFKAAELSKGPVASVPLPLLPYAFHGTWSARG